VLRGSSHADPRERTHLAWMREPSPARASSMTRTKFAGKWSLHYFGSLHTHSAE
jgi:hypothetical protein